MNEHDHGDEDPQGTIAVRWLAVMRPLNSGAHPAPGAYGVPFGAALHDVAACQMPWLCPVCCGAK